LSAACIAVGGGKLTAGDLTKADTAFGALDASLVFSFAPAIGEQRTVTGGELAKWASEHGIQNVTVGAACFERAIQELNAKDIAAAVRTAIGPDVEDLQIDVVEICACKVPKGKLEFGLDGASPASLAHSDVPVLWRGQWMGEDGTTYPVWVRVRIVASVQVVRAVKDLRQQHILAAEDLQMVKIQASPLSFPRTASVQAYAGKAMKISLQRGAILRPDFVRAPNEVERGSLVTVEVTNGAAHLALRARAETAGNAGQIVTLTNPAGAARFQALVAGPGHAVVNLSAASLSRAEASNEDAVQAREALPRSF
jgi:flagella basal body P-ring formation protein FlgA